MADTKGDVPCADTEQNEYPEIFVWKTAREKRFEELEAVFKSFAPFSLITSGIIMHFILDLEFICPENVRGRRERFRGHTNNVLALDLDPTETYLFSSSSDHFVKMWNVCSARSVRTFQGHFDRIYTIACSHDGQRLFAAGKDKTIRMWDIETGCLIHTWCFKGSCYSIAVTRDDKYVIASYDDTTIWGYIGVFDIEADLKKSEGEKESQPPIFERLEFSKWCRRQADHPSEPCRTFEGHDEAVLRIVLSHDERHLFSASHDRTLRMWDFDTTECVQKFIKHDSSVLVCAVTKDSSRLVSGSRDADVRVWDTKTGSVIHILEGHKNLVMGLALNKSDDIIFSAAYDNQIRMWDMKTGACVHILEGHYDGVVALKLKADDSLLFSSSKDRSIITWYLMEEEDSMENDDQGPGAGAAQSSFGGSLEAFMNQEMAERHSY